MILLHFPDNSFSCFAGILPFYTSSAELSQFLASCNGLEELSRDIIVMHFPINSSCVFAFYYFVQYNGNSDKPALVLFE